MEGYTGQIILFAGNFIPLDWLECNGQLLQIQQYQALYSIIGTLYGGDAKQTFALPDLKSRVPVGYNGNDSDFAKLGQKGGQNSQTVTTNGQANITLGLNNLPTHTHTATFTSPGTSVSIPAVKSKGNTKIPGSGVYLAEGVTDNGDEVSHYSTSKPDTKLDPIDIQITGSVEVQNTGLGQPFSTKVVSQGSFDNKQQYLTLRYIICVNGLYPERS